MPSLDYLKTQLQNFYKDTSRPRSATLEGLNIIKELCSDYIETLNDEATDDVEDELGPDEDEGESE